MPRKRSARRRKDNSPTDVLESAGEVEVASATQEELGVIEEASASEEIVVEEVVSTTVENVISVIEKTRGVSEGLEEEFEKGLELSEGEKRICLDRVEEGEEMETDVNANPEVPPIQTEEEFENVEEMDESQNSVSKYLVCQTDAKSVVGGKLSGQGPFFMGIPDEIVSGKRRLQMGDVVMVSQWVWKVGFERLSYDVNPVDETRPWYVQGRINVQAIAQNVSDVSFVTGTFCPGIVTDLKRYKGGDFRSAVVMASQMLRPQTIYARHLTEMSPGRITLNQVLYLQLASITSPQEWWMGENYLLPHPTPYMKGDEIKAHQNHVVIGAKDCHDSFCFPLDKFSERLMGAAAAVQRTHEMVKLAKQAVTVQLVWDRPQVRDEEVQRNLKKAQFLSFDWTLTNKSSVADFLESWEEDTPVNAKIANDTKAHWCAHGHVISASASEINPGIFTIKVKLILSFQAKKGYEKAWEDWESILDEMESYLVLVPNYGGLTFREMCFEKTILSDIAQGNAPVSPILRVLMGKGTDETRTAVRLTGNEKVGKLNEEQRIAHALFLDNETRVIFMQAPAGTGKSVSVAECIASVLKKDPDAAILAVSPLNVAVCELVKDTMEALTEKVPMLALFSGQGKGRYMDRIRPLGDNLLVEAVQRDGNIPPTEGAPGKKWNEEKLFQKYVDDFNKAPRRARERTTTAALLNMTKYRVYFMTLALAEELALDLGNINYVLVDECGQATLSAILSTLTQFRMVRKILLTGDKQQLRVHLPSQMLPIRGKYGFESVLEVLERAKGIDRTVLSRCYRSHSAIVKCLDAGVYAPAGDRLVPGKPDAEMSFFLNFMGPRIVTENCPVVLIHQKTPAQQESVSFSSHNPEQRETALEFLGIIQRTFSGLIQIVCFYQAERKQVTLEIERRNWQNVKAGTVDSIQSQEADLVIVLTTRTGAGRTEDVNIGKEFWADAARTTVAISRPRFGLIVIGDLTLLWHKGEVWRRFLDQALKMTVAVTPDYIGLISNPWPNRVGNTITRPNGSVPMAYEFYSERDSTLRHESLGQRINTINFSSPSFLGNSFSAFAQPDLPRASTSSFAPPSAQSFGMMVIDTSVPPPAVYGRIVRAGPNVRMTPYPLQREPRTSYAEAVEHGRPAPKERRTDVICRRCGRFGHIEKRCRT
ncbi:hypothetical protein niasHS_004245 [Heterodera schachtii]|uniref:CCHC-type domain-containing protein n=1 Tax=Heterodera schachtii TaxID=97005 RepID=A0ABD2JKI8_HETSC